MRLMGLPAVEKYPNAIVSRREEYIGIVFLGEEGEQTMNAPLEYIGGDAEAAELRLLADLKERGYEVRREEPSV